MPKPTVQRVTDIASRTAVVQPLQPKKSRKNIGKQNSKQARVLAMLRAPAGVTIAYESDRLATAFGPRLLCRCGAQEASPQPELEEGQC